jgi:hypothetical protein
VIHIFGLSIAGQYNRPHLISYTWAASTPSHSLGGSKRPSPSWTVCSSHSKRGIHTRHPQVWSASPLHNTEESITYQRNTEPRNRASDLSKLLKCGYNILTGLSVQNSFFRGCGPLWKRLVRILQSRKLYLLCVESHSFSDWELAVLRFRG